MVGGVGNTQPSKQRVKQHQNEQHSTRTTFMPAILTDPRLVPMTPGVLHVKDPDLSRSIPIYPDLSRSIPKASRGIPRKLVPLTEECRTNCRVKLRLIRCSFWMDGWMASVNSSFRHVQNVQYWCFSFHSSNLVPIFETLVSEFPTVSTFWGKLVGKLDEFWSTIFF